MMERKLSSLNRCEFDLLVIGGGIFGACAAWDATQRGLSVALIDRGDFCSATSANSYKLIHGGMRYLQHVDAYRVRQSANARRAMMRIAPHLVTPLPIVVPTYGHGMKGKQVMRIAMAIYDGITVDRNRGIDDPQRRVPYSQCISRSEVMTRYPGIKKEGLTGAGIFYDGQMYNPPRLVLAFLRTAAESGAIVANYVKATKFISKKNRVYGVQAYDVLGGETLEIYSKVVLNATGPYAEGILERCLGQSLRPETPWSRDAYFIVARRLLKGEGALALPAVTRDPDAILSRGERHLFLVPWRNYTLVGVWHKVYKGDPDAYNVTEEDLDTFIREINQVYPPLELTLDDVSFLNAGLIPFGENDPGTKDLKFAHRSRLVDHARLHDVQGLVTLIGARYTTGQCEAAKAIDLVFQKLSKRAPPSHSHRTPLYGGDIDQFEAVVRKAARTCPSPIDAHAVRALVHNHGSRYAEVLDYIRSRPNLDQTIGSSTVLKAEVVHAVHAEMAQTLADVVLRRTDLGTGEYPGHQALNTCAELMAAELCWGVRETQREVQKLIDSFPVSIRSRKEEVTRNGWSGPRSAG